VPGADLWQQLHGPVCMTSIGPTNRARTHFSSFEALAIPAGQLPRSSGDVFSALLAGVPPHLAGLGWALRPLRNEEAIHRAYQMLQDQLYECGSAACCQFSRS
jgi:phosphoenolpyruvate carboxylase